MRSVTRKKRTRLPWPQAGSAGAAQRNVLALFEVVTVDELQHERLVDAGSGLEVELNECLVSREAAAFSLRSAELRRSN